MQSSRLVRRLASRVTVLVVLTTIGASALGALVGNTRHSGSQLTPAALQLDELEAEGACKAGRWPVKTLTDPGAKKVGLTAIPTTVSDLGSLARPKPALDDSTPRLPAETQVETVSAALYADHLESDLDIHLVLHDPAKPSASMIAEFPDSRCTTNAAPNLRSLMTQARDAYVKACGPASGDQGNYYVDGTAQITGVRLFDTIVGQFGRAPNAIELHPVLGFKITGPCRKTSGPTRFDLTSSIVEGSTLHGTVSWQATVGSEAAHISTVEFLVDGTRVGEAQAAPRSIAVNTSRFVDGPHSFAVRVSLNDGSTSLLVDHVKTKNGVAAGNPTISALPARVTAGQAIVVRARGFGPQETLSATVTRSHHRWALATGLTTGAGTATLRIRVGRSAPAGVYLVTVCNGNCTLGATTHVAVNH